MDQEVRSLHTVVHSPDMEHVVHSHHKAQHEYEQETSTSWLSIIALIIAVIAIVLAMVLFFRGRSATNSNTWTVVKYNKVPDTAAFNFNADNRTVLYIPRNSGSFTVTITPRTSKLGTCFIIDNTENNGQISVSDSDLLPSGVVIPAGNSVKFVWNATNLHALDLEF